MKLLNKTSIFLMYIFSITTLSTPIFAQEKSKRGEIVHYSVRKNDNLYEIARKYFFSINEYKIVQRMNNIPNPYRIPVGTTLKIPRKLLRYKPVAGQVFAAHGQVYVVRKGKQQRLNPGEKIFEDDAIETGANSFTTVRFEDGALVSFPSQSLVKVQRLRQTLLTGGYEKLFAVDHGRMRALVPRLKDEDGFEAATPRAVSAVRGTDFRVAYDREKDRSLTEVIDGNVQVDSAADRFAIIKGFGVAVLADGDSEMRALLPAPVIAVADGGLSGEALDFAVEPLDGAAAYRFQLAKDDAFLDLVAETETTSRQATFTAPESGIWYFRVTGIDVVGLAGLSATRKLETRSLNIGLSRDGHFQPFNKSNSESRFRIQIMQGAPDGAVIIDKESATFDDLLVAGLPDGTYYWRVMALPGKPATQPESWTAPRRLIISRQQ